jgi:hypothetical protein
MKYTLLKLVNDQPMSTWLGVEEERDNLFSEFVTDFQKDYPSDLTGSEEEETFLVDKWVEAVEERKPIRLSRSTYLVMELDQECDLCHSKGRRSMRGQGASWTYICEKCRGKGWTSDMDRQNWWNKFGIWNR